MPAATVRLLSEASQMEPEVALRRFVENALGQTPDPALVETIMAHRLARPQDPAGWAAQAAAGTGYAGGDRAGDIAAPTLVVTGTADLVVDPANSDLLGEMIPDARVEKVADAGHLVFWEYPALVADLINDFLA